MQRQDRGDEDLRQASCQKNRLQKKSPYEDRDAIDEAALQAHRHDSLSRAEYLPEDCRTEDAGAVAAHIEHKPRHGGPKEVASVLRIREQPPERRDRTTTAMARGTLRDHRGGRCGGRMSGEMC